MTKEEFLHKYRPDTNRNNLVTDLDELLREEKTNEFNRGYSCAVANLINLHGVSTESMETFKQNFSSIADVKKCGASDFDIEEISKLFKE